MKTLFNNYVEVTDLDKAPFDCYFFIHWGKDGYYQAFELDNDADINNIQAMIDEAYPELTIELSDHNFDSDYCAVITDGRTPNGSIVWDSKDFYITN